jgi:hypothetical protein
VPTLSTETRGRLRAVSTATLCTALFKRGLRNQFIQDESRIGFAGRRGAIMIVLTESGGSPFSERLAFSGA